MRDIKKVIDDLFEQKRQQEEVAKEVSKREAERRSFFIKEYNKVVNDIILPILRDTVTALKSNGMAAYVKDNRANRNDTVVLIVTQLKVVRGRHEGSTTFVFEIRKGETDHMIITQKVKGNINAISTALDEVDKDYMKDELVHFLKSIF